MASQIDYQILLQEIVKTAKEAADLASKKSGAENRALLFAYYDILDVIKTQAEVMEIPLSEIGMEGVSLDALLSAQTKRAA